MRFTVIHYSYVLSYLTLKKIKIQPEKIERFKVLLGTVP